LTIEAKITALVQAFRLANEGSHDVVLPHWEDDPLFAPLTEALRSWQAQTIAKRAIAVQQERDYFEAILNQIPADVVIIDPEFRYVFLSSYAVKDKAMREWLIGKTDFEYCAHRGIDPKLASDRQAILQQAYTTRTPVQMIEIRADHQGVVRHKLRMLSPVLNAEGEPILFIGHGMDITPIAEKEQSLRTQNEALKKANDELDQFVYRVSHDLRAPLSSVLGLVTLIQQTPLPPEATRFVQLMERATTRMDGFIRDIVDYSKNTRQDVVAEEIQLENEIEAVLQQLGYMQGADRVQIRLNLQVTAPLYCDRFRLGVVLNNIISNAVKYQDPAKPNPFADISAKVTPEEVEISVADNGIGIEAQYIHRLFEMFFRASNAATGTGIGLYIVQEMAHKLGGHATIQSEIGIGTTITIVFPNGPAPGASL
jgi:signal transduction histidine kinase